MGEDTFLSPFLISVQAPLSYLNLTSLHLIMTPKLSLQEFVLVYISQNLLLDLLKSFKRMKSRNSFCPACPICGNKDHTLSTCPLKPAPCSELVVTKLEANHIEPETSAREY